MNNERRKALRRALALITEAQTIIMTAGEDERDYYDNMPEGLQASEKGDRASEVADALEDAASNCDDLINAIEDVLS